MTCWKVIKIGLFVQYLTFSNWQITKMLFSLEIAHDFYLQELQIYRSMNSIVVVILHLGWATLSSPLTEFKCLWKLWNSKLLFKFKLLLLEIPVVVSVQTLNGNMVVSDVFGNTHSKNIVGSVVSVFFSAESLTCFWEEWPPHMSL